MKVKKRQGRKARQRTFRLLKLPAWTPLEQIPTPNTGEGMHMDACWVNSRYEVYVYRLPAEKPEPGYPPELVHLSFKQMPDRQGFIPWRDKQRIKNEILGPEWECVELYPAESRLVDTSNQYHLWCLPPGYPFPFGFGERLVMEAPTLPGVVQTPWRDGHVPLEVQAERAERG